MGLSRSKIRSWFWREPLGNTPSIDEGSKEILHNQASEKGQLEEQIYATLYGQCIGDAIGLLTEFMSKDQAKDSYRQNKLEYEDKINDGHRERWDVGDWTDDSDQMILIMQSLTAKKGEVNPKDFASRLVRWMKNGFPEECGDNGGLGIGQTTYITITRKGFENNPHKISEEVWEDSERYLAPNGGIMRTSILGIHAWWDEKQVYQNAIDICKTTHFDPRCQASAVSVCIAISLMLQRGDQHYKNGEYIIPTIVEDVFQIASTCLQEDKQKNELNKYLHCKNLSELKLDEADSIGYTYKCLGAGFWALRKTDFREALEEIVMCSTFLEHKLLSANRVIEAQILLRSLKCCKLDRTIRQGGDADTNCAVAGALLGCKLGSRKYFPKTWRKLKYEKWLNTLIKEYLEVLEVMKKEHDDLKLQETEQS